MGLNTSGIFGITEFGAFSFFSYKMDTVLSSQEVAYLQYTAA